MAAQSTRTAKACYKRRMTLQKPWRPLKIGSSYDARFSRDGTRLVVVGRSISVWDLASRKKLSRTRGFSNPSSAQFSLNGDVIAGKSTTGRIVTFDAGSGSVIRDFRNQAEGEGTDIEFSPCGKYLVDGSWNGFVTVRDADNGEVVFRKSMDGALVRDVRPLDRGQRWVVVHGQRAIDSKSSPPPTTIEIWDWPFTGAPSFHWYTDMNFIWDCAISSDGGMIATLDGTPPKRVRIFSLGTKDVLGETTVDASLRGTGRRLAWSHDNRNLYSIEHDDFAVYELSVGGLKRIQHAEFYYASGVTVAPSLLALSSWGKGFVVDANAIPDRLLKVPEKQPDWYQRRAPD